ncbi:MAG: OadG family protein [Selenomonadaceae bacterium]|nr:OadG family protein [Selenomonadaceae bacterium]
MGHPVTTNPFIIMLINMTVVFIVLISLSFLIRAIHYFDPTAPKEESKPEVAPAPAPEPVAAPEPAPVIEEGISSETVAVIMAALASCGYGASSVHGIRIANHNSTPWEQSTRFQPHDF